MSNQAVVKTEPTPLIVVPDAPRRETINSNLVIPKLHLMQQLSQLVVAEDSKVKPGQIVRSTTGQVVGDQKTPIHIIPLMFNDEWSISEKVGQKYQWRRTEPRTQTNDTLPWEFTENGTAWKRTKVISLFALLPTDLEAFKKEMKSDAPDLDAVVLPVNITFRSTSFKTGKDIATFFAKAEEMKSHNAAVRVHHYMLPLTCEAVEKDGNKWFIYKTGKSARIAAEFVADANRWAMTLSGLKEIRVDADEEEADGPSSDIC